MSEALDLSPFHQDDSSDASLCQRAASGERAALKSLIERHQPWIYNLSLRLVLSPVDADDLAQDATIRIITRLAQFEGRSKFRTWAYRIVVNTFLDWKRRPLEQAITTFTAYGESLDALPLEELLVSDSHPEIELLIEEAKVGCMLGMLLCLSREQRLVYVLGEVFQVRSDDAAEILEISAATFRKRLQRARRDLVSFMNEKCGLMNRDNPCRCSRKTNAFIREGWVDPEKFKFTAERVTRLKTLAPRHDKELCTLMEKKYADLFRDHPLLPAPDYAARLDQLLNDPRLSTALEFT